MEKNDSLFTITFETPESRLNEGAQSVESAQCVGYVALMFDANGSDDNQVRVHGDFSIRDVFGGICTLFENVSDEEMRKMIPLLCSELLGLRDAGARAAQ